jgi:hypothetical protein
MLIWGIRRARSFEGEEALASRKLHQTVAGLAGEYLWSSTHTCPNRAVCRQEASWLFLLDRSLLHDRALQLQCQGQ